MCLNTPVIVRDIPGNRNIVTDGETGLLFKSVQVCINLLTYIHFVLIDSKFYRHDNM